MTVAGLVGWLAAEGVLLSVDGKRLRCRGPSRTLEGALPELKARRDQLVAFLTRPGTELTEDELLALGFRRTLADEVIDEAYQDWEGVEILAAMREAEAAACRDARNTPAQDEPRALLHWIVAEWQDALLRTGINPEARGGAPC